MPLHTAPDNALGLTKWGWWSDLHRGDPLETQLRAAGVQPLRRDVPALVGMAGCAYLLGYISPKIGRNVTVLVIPNQTDVDAFSEDYFYFEDMALETAAAFTDWPKRYDALLALTRTKPAPVRARRLPTDDAATVWRGQKSMDDPDSTF